MRVSVLRGDPDFTEVPYYFNIYLNGRKLHNCVTADEEKGEVLVLENIRFTPVAKHGIVRIYKSPCFRWERGLTFFRNLMPERMKFKKGGEQVAL